MQVAATWTIRFEIAGAFEREVRFCGWCKIGRAADQPRVSRRDGIEDLARRVAAGNPFRVGGKGREAAVPTIRELAPLHALDLLGELRVLLAIRREQRRPRLASAAAALTDAIAKMLTHPVGDEKLCIFRPTIATLCEPNLLLAERLAVGRAGIMFVRGAIADVTVDQD